QAKPHAITKMGLIVNFDAGVVTGFTEITARIDDINANSVVFNGTTIHPSGAEWSVHGAMDRITGSLGATVIWFNRRTNDLLMRMNYELICKPASFQPRSRLEEVAQHTDDQEADRNHPTILF